MPQLCGRAARVNARSMAVLSRTKHGSLGFTFSFFLSLRFAFVWPDHKGLDSV